MPLRRHLPILLFSSAAIVFFALFSIIQVKAVELQQEATESPKAVSLLELTPPPPPAAEVPSETCLGCHSQQSMTMPLDDGSNWSIYVNPETHAGSVHGQAELSCVDCHTTITEYPHPEFSALDGRDASLQLNPICTRCHVEQTELEQDSVHEAALMETLDNDENPGNRFAAVCTDCHSAHDVQRINDPQTGELLPEAHLAIPETCAKCHSAIYQVYLESVHGSTLVKDNNTDVPTCTDCHGVHNITDPTTAEFRVRSPQICATCHTDAELMDKYDISTNVMETYVADFHGTTVMLFEKQSPDAETNKPVCYDCHGAHDIKRTDDPEKGLQVKENLLLRCQTCHPDASENFPDSWLSHYIPSPERYPIVYNVNLFYRFFIPGVLGGMFVLVVLDFARASANRFGRKKQKPAPVVAEAAPTPEETKAVAETPVIPAVVESEPEAPTTPFETESEPEAPQSPVESDAGQQDQPEEPKADDNAPEVDNG